MIKRIMKKITALLAPPLDGPKCSVCADPVSNKEAEFKPILCKNCYNSRLKVTMPAYYSLKFKEQHA